MKKKGGEQKMEEIKVVRKLLKEVCPICNKAIVGTTENQVKYNLRIHMDAKHNSASKK
jgi:hypothetical protein